MWEDFPQVSQYVSRAEELKALVASDNRLSFEEARTSRDVLRGNEHNPAQRQSPSVSTSALSGWDLYDKPSSVTQCVFLYLVLIK